MSVFISYNFKTGHETAKLVDEELNRHKIDVWWIRNNLGESQLDSVIDRVLSTCQRCILIWSTLQLSEWQRSEIESIRQRLLMRRPPADTTDFFLVLRNREISSDKRLPLLECSEYIEYTPGQPVDLSHLAGYVSASLPLTNGAGFKPAFHLQSGCRCYTGKQSFTGEVLRDVISNEMRQQYCWIFLEDDEGKWYIQHPRPTFTHAKRWIAPTIILGDNIRAILLIAASRSVHKKIIDKVLAESWGAIEHGSDIVKKVTVVQRLTIDLARQGEERGFQEADAPTDS